MTVTQDYIERLSRWFARVGVAAYDHRWRVVLACAVLIGGSLYLASGARIDNSFEAYFDRGDRFYQSYLQFREDFGSDEISYIVYEAPQTEYGPWDLEVMRRIAGLTDRIESEVPFVKEVTSLANVEFLDAVPDGIDVVKLVDDFPATQEALLEFRDKILDKPIYLGGLVSEDGRYAGIIVEMEKSSIDPPDEIRVDPDKGNAIDNLYPQATYDALERLLADPEYDGIVFHHTGDVPLNAVVNRITAEESLRLGIACFLIVGLLLALFVRRPIGVVGPLAVVGTSVLLTVGFVSLMGWSLDQMFGMMPTLLIAVGVADSVHIISEFRVFHAELGDRREAIRRTLYLVGTPCLLT
ncbi:MAG: RND transporter, partial [Deltaproteobacteria bacterium]